MSIRHATPAMPIRVPIDDEMPVNRADSSSLSAMPIRNASPRCLPTEPVRDAPVMAIRNVNSRYRYELQRTMLIRDVNR